MFSSIGRLQFRGLSLLFADFDSDFYSKHKENDLNGYADFSGERNQRYPAAEDVPDSEECKDNPNILQTLS